MSFWLKDKARGGHPGWIKEKLAEGNLHKLCFFLGFSFLEDLDFFFLIHSFVLDLRFMYLKSAVIAHLFVTPAETEML